MLSFINRHSNKFKILAVFASGQFLFQLVNMVTGFLILRWLTKEEYARFTIIFGFQCMIGALVELGFPSCFMALIAPFNKDDQRISDYYGAILYWRRISFWIVLPTAITIIYLFTLSKQWSFFEFLLLIIPVPFGVYFQGLASLHSVIVQIRNQYKLMYYLGVLSGLGRLILSSILYFLHALTSWSYLIINSAMIAMNFFQLRSKTKLELVQDATVRAKGEVIDFIKPTIIGHLFYAFQSQISVLLISVFGQEVSIADVGALGRLGQFFVFINTFNGVIVQPYFAKLDKSKVVLHATFLFVGFGLGLGVLTLFAFVRGDILLLVLGKKYYGLTKEVGWSILASSISVLIGSIWAIFTSRKWVTYNIGFINIMVFIVVNIACCVILDLTQTINILKISMYSALANLLVMLVFLILNFRKMWSSD